MRDAVRGLRGLTDLYAGASVASLNTEEAEDEFWDEFKRLSDVVFEASIAYYHAAPRFAGARLEIADLPQHAAR
jgi:hypothetical protein